MRMTPTVRDVTHVHIFKTFKPFADRLYANEHPTEHWQASTFAAYDSWGVTERTGTGIFANARVSCDDRGVGTGWQ